MPRNGPWDWICFGDISVEFPAYSISGPGASLSGTSTRIAHTTFHGMPLTAQGATGPCLGTGARDFSEFMYQQGSAGSAGDSACGMDRLWSAIYSSFSLLPLRRTFYCGSPC